MKTLLSATTLAIATLAVSCSLVADGTFSEANDELAGTSWELVAFAAADDTSGYVSPDTLAGRYTLRFPTDSTVSAQADCNECGGYYRSESDGVFSATMACTRADCNRSSEFSGAVNTAERYEIVQGRLRLPYTDLESNEKRVLIFEPLDERRE